MPDRIVESVWGFFAVYVMAFMVMLPALLATGLDIITAFSAVGVNNNLGLAYRCGTDLRRTAGGQMDSLPGHAAGRLEVFTLLVLFTPMF